jgi:hypothetical protein
MVDSTAGIGEAGALINRANAPAGLDITRGIQMADKNALKRAQLEAAKAAKLQAVKDKMGKVSRVDVGKYKNVGVSKEANEKGRELAARKYLAYVNDDVEEQMNLDREVSTLQDYYTNKDNTVSTLKGKKNYEYVQKAGEAIDAGNLDEASKYNKPYAPVYTQGQMGDFIVQAPEATDLGKIYSTVLKTAAHNDIKFSSLADAATNTDNYSINRRMTSNEISNYTTELLKNEGYVKSVLYDPDFQSFYDKKFGGSADPIAVNAGLLEYTQKRIEDKNIEKMSVRAKPKDNSTFTIGGSGFGIGNYNFSIVPKTTAEAAAEFENSRVMYGRDAVSSQAFLDGFKQQGGTPITEVVMPENATGTFIVNDPKMGKGIRKGKPVSLLEANGQAYLIYRDNERNTGQIVEMTPVILSQMATYYKTTPENFIDAYHSQGVDLSGYAPKGNIGVQKNDGSKGGSNKKPASSSKAKMVTGTKDNKL